MPAALDADAGLGHESGAAPSQDAGALGHRAQRIELRQRHAAQLQGPQAVRELSQDRFVQILLARQRAIARAQDFLFETLELLRDESHSRYHRQTTEEDQGDTLGVLARNFDEEA